MRNRGHQDSATRGSAASTRRRHMPLPARARAVVEEIGDTAQSWLQPRVTALLDDFEQRLFTLAEQAPSGTDERRSLDSLNLVRARRGDIEVDFLDQVQRQLAALGDETAGAESAGDAALELLASDAQEESIVVDDMAARSESRCMSALHALAHRFAVLVAQPAFEGDELPLGPHALGAVLRASVADVGLPLVHRIELYRRFDQLVMAQIESLYGLVDARFIAHGILVHLQLQLRSMAPASGHRGPAASASAPGAATESTQRESTADAHASAWSPDSAAEDDNDDALFAALGAILDEHRRNDGQRRAQTSDQVASLPQVQQVLAQLQARSSEAAVAGDSPHQSMQRLRLDLLAQLRHHDPQARTPQLAEPQLNTIELMTMLFERIDEDIRSSACRNLLTRVQAPLLRVALDDHSFFTAGDHPARRWLNAAAEASARWDGDGKEGDAALRAQLQAMVARVNNEFDGDTALFEDMRADIVRHVQGLERKAQLVERRHVEASKGRERLLDARARASEAIEARLTGRPVDSLSKALLRKAWADLMALTWLREGEESSTWHDQLAVVDALSGAQPATDVTALRDDLIQGLAQVGVSDGDAQALARKVTTGEDAIDPAGEPITRTELALKLKQRTRIGAAATGDADDDDTETPAPPPLSAPVQAALDQLKTLAFGTWFLIDREPPPALPVRRKMAWYARTSGRCLMVNQRGARDDIDTLEKLAQAMAAGSARLEPEPRGSLIDRAWGAIVAKVKALAVPASVAQEAAP